MQQTTAIKHLRRLLLRIAVLVDEFKKLAVVNIATNPDTRKIG